MGQETSANASPGMSGSLTWEGVTVIVTVVVVVVPMAAPSPSPSAFFPPPLGTSTVTGRPLESMPNKGPGFTPKAMAFFGWNLPGTVGEEQM